MALSRSLAETVSGNERVCSPNCNRTTTSRIGLIDPAKATTRAKSKGMERLALALFKHHGLDVGAWPSSVRAALAL